MENMERNKIILQTTTTLRYDNENTIDIIISFMENTNNVDKRKTNNNFSSYAGMRTILISDNNTQPV